MKMVEPITKTEVIIFEEGGCVFQKWDHAFFVPAYAGSKTEFRVCRTNPVPDMPGWTTNITLGQAVVGDRHTIVERYPEN